MNPSLTNLPSLGAALFLAVIQGATEFLPVSSSGHLAAAQLIWPSIAYPGLTLEVALHVGTTGAVLIYYRRLIAELLRGVWRGDAPRSEGELAGLTSRRWLTYLVLASVPTAAIGLGAERFIREAFDRIEVIAACLAATGVVLMGSRWLRGAASPLTAGRAIAVGASQGLAILPGISRSGMTISLALMLGVSHRQAVSFSFLLSVPAVLGAAVLDAVRLLDEPISSTVLFANIGFATLCAGAIGYACIGLVHRATSGDWWHRFAWYCWALATVLAWSAS